MTGRRTSIIPPSPGHPRALKRTTPSDPRLPLLRVQSLPAPTTQPPPPAVYVPETALARQEWFEVVSRPTSDVLLEFIAFSSALETALIRRGGDHAPTPDPPCIRPRLQHPPRLENCAGRRPRYPP